MQAFVRQMLCVQYILHTHTYIHIYYIQFEHWRHINFFFLPSFSSDFIKLNKHSISLNIIKGRTLILKAAQKVYDNNYIVLCNSMDVLYNHQSVVTDFHFTMIKKNTSIFMLSHCLHSTQILSDIIYYFCMLIIPFQNVFPLLLMPHYLKFAHK